MPDVKSIDSLSLKITSSTEEAVKANIRNREGKRVFYLGAGDQLTPGARDWLRQEKIDILPASEARPERFELLGGGYIEEKPEHMTHLNSQVLVDKTHPRIAFRGALDTLEADTIRTARILADILLAASCIAVSSSSDSSSSSACSRAVPA